MEKIVLTPEQEARIEPWKEKWLENALQTRRMTPEDVRISRESLQAIYQNAKYPAPPAEKMPLVSSPYAGRVASGIAAAYYNLIEDKQPKQAAKMLEVLKASTNEVYVAASAACGAIPAADTLQGEFLATSPKDDDWAETADYAAKIRADFTGEFAVASDGEKKKVKLAEYIIERVRYAYRMWQGGNLWSGVTAYVTFFRYEVGVQTDYTEWEPWEQIATRCGPRFVHPEFAILCDFPTTITLDAEKNPHGDNAPFAKWADGTSIFISHGVRIPRWLAMTHERDMDPAKMVTIDNAEIRREFVRKVGIERILNALSPGAIDKKTYYTKDGREHPYELHRLRVGSNDWTYLKMINPSVDLAHVEGVPNTCRTVQDALNFRNGLRPEQVSETGADWVQQGDVLLFPEGAKTYKPFPAYLS